MKNIVIAIVTVLLFAGCKKAQPVASIVELSIDISINNNADGTDLLNSVNQGFINSEDISIYYLRNGIKEPVNTANLDYPKGFFIFQAEKGSSNLEVGKYYLRLFVNAQTNSNSISTTWLEIKGRGTDVLTSQISKQSNNVSVAKIWLNGDLQWSVKDGYPKIEIMK